MMKSVKVTVLAVLGALLLQFGLANAADKMSVQESLKHGLTLTDCPR